MESFNYLKKCMKNSGKEYNESQQQSPLKAYIMGVERSRDRVGGGREYDSMTFVGTYFLQSSGLSKYSIINLHCLY